MSNVFGGIGGVGGKGLPSVPALPVGEGDGFWTRGVVLALSALGVVPLPWSICLLALRSRLFKGSVAGGEFPAEGPAPSGSLGLLPDRLYGGCTHTHTCTHTKEVHIYMYAYTGTFNSSHTHLFTLI